MKWTRILRPVIAIFLLLSIGACEGKTRIENDNGGEAVIPGDDRPETEPVAFPGAEGFGRKATGGRYGTVYYVTTLEDTAAKGSLRYALENSEAGKTPQTVLFKVCGNIELVKELKVRNSNITIAGQSAPGDGICLKNFPVFIEADNVIIRFMRFRMGDQGDTNNDGADALGGRNRNNIIIDHCSMSWCTDECVSFYANSNFTLQWCIISESLRLSKHSKGAHGYGGIWGGTDASFHHNLLAHHDSRNPRLGPSPLSTPENERVDMRNNVIYNWCGNSTYGGEAMHVNIVNNYYKPGPATPTGSKRGRIIAIDKKIDQTDLPTYAAIFDRWGTFYIAGNVVDDGKNDRNCQNATNDNWTYGVYNQFASKYGTVSDVDKKAMKLSTPVPYGEVTTHPAAVAYEKVLQYAGASLARDSYDSRIIDEVRTGTARFTGSSVANAGGYPAPGIIDTPFDIRPADASADWSPWPRLEKRFDLVDSDNDGIPDEWERSHGLDPNDPSDALRHTLDGKYTNLEYYLNGLVESIVKGQS